MAHGFDFRATFTINDFSRQVHFLDDLQEAKMRAWSKVQGRFSGAFILSISSSP